MMPVLLHSKSPVSRGNVRCSLCTARIEKGTKYLRGTLVYDGHIYDFLECPPCEEVISWVLKDDYYDYYQGGPTCYDAYEWATEYKDDPERGDVANAFLDRATRQQRS